MWVSISSCAACCQWNILYPLINSSCVLVHTIFLCVVRRPLSITFLPSRSDSLYVGTTFEITCFVNFDARAVDTNIQAMLGLIDSPLTSIENVSRVNDSTFSGELIYSVLKRTDRVLTIIAFISSMPQNPFIRQSPLRVASRRLSVQCKYCR
jgi:hypothetical protein